MLFQLKASQTYLIVESQVETEHASPQLPISSDQHQPSVGQEKDPRPLMQSRRRGMSISWSSVAQRSVMGEPSSPKQRELQVEFQVIADLGMGRKNKFQMASQCFRQLVR